MKIKLKPIDKQVIVITGATSGIGLSTARRAAEQGATLVLSARNGQALEQPAQEFAADEVPVTTVTADVGKAEDVARIGQAAIDHVGVAGRERAVCGVELGRKDQRQGLSGR